MSDWEYIGEGGLPDIRGRTLKRSGRVSLDSDGVAQIAFDPPIIMDSQPRMSLTPHVTTSSDKLIAANVLAGSYTQDGEGRWTGCVVVAGEIKAKLPKLNSLTITAQLDEFRITNAEGVEGEVVDWMAF